MLFATKNEDITYLPYYVPVQLEGLKPELSLTSFVPQSGNMATVNVLKDGRVVRASASGAVDLGLIPNVFKPMTL